MLHQSIPDLDFNTYFGVPTNNNDEQQQQQPINVMPHSYYNNQQQQPPYQMLNWFKNQQHYDTPLSTPNNSNCPVDSNHNNPHSDYFCPTNSTAPQINTSTTTPPSTNNNGLPTPMSEVMFPETPRTSQSPTQSDDSLSNAFATIDQWRYEHTTRHWRKKPTPTTDLSPLLPLESGQLKKVAHNAIERRYRNNINDRIQELKNVVPALYSSAHKGDTIDGVEVARKLNKATILHKATEYIHHLKHTNALAEQENQILQSLLAQMPGGTKVMERFKVQKEAFQKEEQQRLAKERKEWMEQEKVERQRVLRERAAQRAALAELLPKPARRPYQRRNKKQEGSNVKQVMVVFLGLTVSSVFGKSPHHTTTSLDYW